jgi:hypothetical protein
LGGGVRRRGEARPGFHRRGGTSSRCTRATRRPRARPNGFRPGSQTWISRPARNHTHAPSDGSPEHRASQLHITARVCFRVWTPWRFTLVQEQGRCLTSITTASTSSSSREQARLQMRTVSTWFAPATSSATRRMLGIGTVPRQRCSDTCDVRGVWRLRPRRRTAGLGRQLRHKPGDMIAPSV